MNDAKDERLIPERVETQVHVPYVPTVEAVEVEENDQVGVQTRKVWLILCIISIVGVSYSWGITAEASAWLPPGLLLATIILLTWLRKPAQRPILVKIAPCFGIRMVST